jgi:hypothetical protein
MSEESTHGTRRRLVKAGVTAAWAVPVMTTLRPEQVSALSACVSVDPSLLDTSGEPCDPRSPRAGFCCNTAAGNFIRLRICAGPAGCSTLVASGTLTSNTEFLAVDFQSSNPLKGCRNGQDISGSLTQPNVAGKVFSTALPALGPNQCLTLDIHVKDQAQGQDDCALYQGRKAGLLTYSVTCAQSADQCPVATGQALFEVISCSR